jgi:TrmH family RNA methyltransferase
MRRRSKRSSKRHTSRENLINSLANAKVKHTRSLNLKKNRLTNRQFAVEGTRVIEESERAGFIPALVFFEPETVAGVERARILLERLQSRTLDVYSVTPKVFHAIAQTENPQGIVAVYSFPSIPPPPEPKSVLILDAVRDPGNVGTILRTAWAAGMDLVLLAPGTADPFNPKVVRAAMGAHFFIPILSQSWDEIARTLGSIPRVYLADPRGNQAFHLTNWSTPFALIVGGEAEGYGEQALRLASARLAIPMPGNAESLNAAVAAGILMFEALRASHHG